MMFLATNRCAVLTIKRDIEDTGAELFGHLRLQCQAFLHPNLYPAVVVTHRQKPGGCLGTHEDAARMHECGQSEQMGNSGLLVLQFFECLVDAFLAECVNRQVLNHLVLTAFAGDGKAKHGVFGNAVLTV